jgi:hypothetical protein
LGVGNLGSGLILARLLLSPSKVGSATGDCISKSKGMDPIVPIITNGSGKSGAATGATEVIGLRRGLGGGGAATCFPLGSVKLVGLLNTYR